MIIVSKAEGGEQQKLVCWFGFACRWITTAPDPRDSPPSVSFCLSVPLDARVFWLSASRLNGPKRGMLLRLIMPLQLLWTHPLVYEEEEAAKLARAMEEEEEDETEEESFEDEGGTTASGEAAKDAAVSICDSSDDVSLSLSFHPAGPCVSVDEKRHKVSQTIFALSGMGRV